MAKYEVFYVRPSEKQRNDINSEGWDSELGKAYLDVTFGRRFPKFNGAIDFDLFEHASTVEVDDIEHTFTRLQNITGPWTNSYPAHTDFPRSMSVGDVIYREDTDAFYWCASDGFMEIRKVKFENYLKGKLT